MDRKIKVTWLVLSFLLAITSGGLAWTNQFSRQHPAKQQFPMERRTGSFVVRRESNPLSNRPAFPKTNSTYGARYSRNEPLIRRSEIPGLLKMARLNTVPMGMGLVAIGAYGARHVPHPSSSLNSGMMGIPIGRLTLGTILTVITTSGSMLINDYYDYRDGIDNLRTKPNRPLVTGAVRPSAVKLVLKYAYALHLTLLCLIDSTFMRLFVLANTMLTYLYSVHLKPITGVKNMICATIVSMAVGLGAVSWGPPSGRAIKMVWKPIVAVAGLIWHREILMDIKDCEGDASVGVRTLPVAYGFTTAYRISLVPLLAAAVAISLFGHDVMGTGRFDYPIRSMVATAALLVQGLISLWSRYRNFDTTSLKIAIEAAPLWLLIVLITLASS